MPRTRFAPSPTGLLHVGNAYSALLCQQWAEKNNAELLLRIEDIDFTRCREEYSEQLINDLQWLGLNWQQGIRNQSNHLDDYHAALEKLRQMDVIYPCFCTRKQIQQDIERMALAPHENELGAPYPGTCRNLSSTQQLKHQDQPFAWRLNIQAAMQYIGENVLWHDGDKQSHALNPDQWGDIIIGRKDIHFSYHLTVVVDDAAQHISHIIRGEDLLSSVGIHRILQCLLHLPKPIYIHHPLLKDTHGQRLAKRNNAISLKDLQDLNVCPKKLKKHLLHHNTCIWPFTLDDSTAIHLQFGL